MEPVVAIPRETQIKSDSYLPSRQFPRRFRNPCVTWAFHYPQRSAQQPAFPPKSFHMAIKKTTVYCKIVFNGLLVHSQVWKVVEIESHTTTDSAGQPSTKQVQGVPHGGTARFLRADTHAFASRLPRRHILPWLMCFRGIKSLVTKLFLKQLALTSTQVVFDIVAPTLPYKERYWPRRFTKNLTGSLHALSGIAQKPLSIETMLFSLSNSALPHAR